ncbi:ParB/RepB/Spo0J family partition protein [Candidatus Uhrbacteria bacterium]|nr:ParB/RepB/Spo0J family partition protein [Candidatus Uhrbacteria bacterium]
MDTFGKGLGSLIPGGVPTPISHPPAPTPPSHPPEPPLPPEARLARGGGQGGKLLGRGVRGGPVLPPHDAKEGDVLRVLTVAPDLVDSNPAQPRTFFDPEKLAELQASIEKHGILEPLIVTEKNDGRFELIAGERRLRAARNLNFAAVPVLVRHADDLERLELSLIENLQRQDLNPIEEAEGYRELIEAFGLTQEEAAKKMGKSRETISNTLRLLELSSEMQKAIGSGRLSIGHARLLLTLDNPKVREEIFRTILEQGLTVKAAETLAAPQVRKKRVGIKDPAVAADEARLREKFNTKVQIEKRGGRGRITMNFYSDEDYAEILGKLAGEDS